MRLWLVLTTQFKGIIMAQESIVSGLFGLTPQAYERQQYEQSLREGQAFGTPQGLYASAAQLGRGIGSFMGAEDPTLLKITAQDQILKSLDFTNPNSIATGIERATQAGIPELAFKLLAVRDDAMKRQMGLQSQQRMQQAQGLLPSILMQGTPDQVTPEKVIVPSLIFNEVSP